MSQPRPESPDPRCTVLQALAKRTGLPIRIELTGAAESPDVRSASDSDVPAAELSPQGRAKYRIDGEIARGGMGVILRGRDTDLGRDLAIKVLDKELARNPSAVQRFVEEAQISGQLQHPGIVPVHELGLMADESPFFTMKLVKGRTLALLIQERNSPTDNRGRLLSIFESVCQTMAYAHSRGVLHRDLKPANIMVGAFGEVQVVDWGLAKVLNRSGEAQSEQAKLPIRTVIETVRSGPDSSGTKSLVGSVMGTLAYMAPEQAQGEVEKLDERADVFSLGAILCEILTGAPPYDAESDDLFVRAAHADLDPARARIESCKADPALVRLCLACLMTARTARPASAADVARAIHQYMVSVEERAHQAELHAAEARIKAAEERRARRLSVALAATIASAVLIVSLGLYWVEHQAVLRSEQTRNAVEFAHDESVELGRAGKLTDALASAQRALALAETGGADATLLERARGFVAKAQLAIDSAELERRLSEKDETLLAQLLKLHLQQNDLNNAPHLEAKMDESFAQAFRDYGVDVEGADLVPAVQRIRQREIAQDVAFALDEWGWVRRRVHGSNSKQAQNLLYLAMDLDPDPVRIELRTAILENDLDTLLRLAEPESVAILPAASVGALGAVIFDRSPEHRPLVSSMMDRVGRLHPGDYVVQQSCAQIFLIQGRPQASLSCYMAALSLRPDDLEARLNSAGALSLLGRLTEAKDLTARCVESFPSNARAAYMHGRILLRLGEYAPALTILTRSLELLDEPRRLADLLVARFYNGLIRREEIERALAHESQLGSMGTLMYGLLEHPDPAQRDPELVLRKIDELKGEIVTEGWQYPLQAMARARLGNWAGALAAIEDQYTPWRFGTSGHSPLMLSPGAYDFLRSLIYSRVGSAAAARECYGRGMATLNEMAGVEPSVWDQSDVMRWRREAEAALGK